jgi:hypothetical protein
VEVIFKWSIGEKMVGAGNGIKKKEGISISREEKLYLTNLP